MYKVMSQMRLFVVKSRQKHAAQVPTMKPQILDREYPLNSFLRCDTVFLQSSLLCIVGDKRASFDSRTRCKIADVNRQK